MKIQDNFVYVVSSTGGLHIINVTDPYNAYKCGTYSEGANLFGLEITATHAYIGSGGSGGRLVAINIINKLNPTVGGYVTIYEGCFGIATYKNNVIIAVGGSDKGGIAVVSITNPGSPS